MLADIREGFLEDAEGGGLHDGRQPLLPEVLAEGDNPARFDRRLLHAVAGGRSQASRRHRRWAQRIEDVPHLRDGLVESLEADPEQALCPQGVEAPEITRCIEVLLGAHDQRRDPVVQLVGDTPPLLVLGEDDPLHHPRQRLLVATGVGQAIAAALMGALTLLGVVTLGRLMVLTFAAGALRGVEHAARQSYAHDVVGAAALVNGLAVLGIAMRSGWLVGSLGAGALIAHLGSGHAYLAVAGAYLAGGLALLAATAPTPVADGEADSLWRGVTGFVTAVRDDPTLLVLMLLTAGAEVLGFAHSDLLNRHVQVTTRLSADLPKVRGDNIQLQQVLLNLIVNACEAMTGNEPYDRSLVIETAAIDHDTVSISVLDNGSGIRVDVVDQLFEPFVTTKQQGLGLGLTICRSIAGAHGGHLWAGNNADRGSAFRLVLPRDGSPASVA